MIPTWIQCGWMIVWVVLAALRLEGVTDLRLQAIAHLVCGSWFGAWAMARSYVSRAQDKTPAFYFWLALTIALLEAGAFLAGINNFDGKAG